MKKKILFVIPTMSMAGAEIALLNLLRTIDPAEYEISLYVLLNQGELLLELPENVRLLNRHPCYLSVFDKEGGGQAYAYRQMFLAGLKHGSGLRSIPYIISNYVDMLRRRQVNAEKLFWKMLSDSGDRFQEHFDIAVSFLEGSSTHYVADYVDADEKIAYVHIDMFAAGYSAKLNRDIYDRMDKIYAVSEETREAFCRMHPSCAHKTFVRENVINREEILNKAEMEDVILNDSGLSILSVGRLMHQKAFDIAISAMALLKKEHLPVRWYVVGEGGLHGELERQIKDMDVEDCFFLLGQKKNPYPYYKACDIYVHASRFEGKSIALQEAKILHKPVVISNVDGNRSIIRDGENGIFCELSAEGIADAVKRLVLDEGLREELCQE